MSKQITSNEEGPQAVLLLMPCWWRGTLCPRDRAGESNQPGRVEPENPNPPTPDENTGIFGSHTGRSAPSARRGRSAHPLDQDQMVAEAWGYLNGPTIAAKSVEPCKG